MRQEKAIEFYEKLYFSEIESKDKIHNRAQANFGLIVIATTVLTYLVKNTTFQDNHWLASIVFFLTAISFALILISVWHLKSVVWGNEFFYCPNPVDINDYHQDLIKYELTYKKYCDENQIVYDESQNPNERILDYIHEEIRACTALNSEANENRSRKMYKCLKFFSGHLPPYLLLSFYFYWPI
ncbi:hypothetical protein ACTUSQ_16845 [Pantoea ananatis]|uniref:hypothetical protein n=1 Tax=Pantoea ananas TaxID=553 RepID=UPI003FA4B44B